MAPMNCQTTRAQVDALLDNALPAAEAAAIVAHIEACPGCRHLWDRARTVQTALRQLPLPAASETARAQVFARFERAAAEMPAPGPAARLRAWLAARPPVPVLAAAAAAVGVAFLIPVAPAEPDPFPAPQEIRLLIDRHDIHEAATRNSDPSFLAGEE